MTTTRTGLWAGVIVTLMVGCGGAAPESKAPSGGYAPSSPTESAAYSDSVGAPAAAPPAQPGMAPIPGMPAPAASAAAESSASGAAMKTAAPESPPAPVAVAPRAPSRQLPQAGQLTAGVWDDNRNFDFFKPYGTRFALENGTDFAMFNEQELTTSRDDANRSQAPHAAIDVQLILDTTGSMGDELSYLQGEFDAIAANLRTKFPNVTPRWSLVVYRDKGDEYVTRTFDFTTDTGKFRRDLRAQSASGGGDTPEAVVEGLGAGLRQGWRQQDAGVAKLAFWVADAPTHHGEGAKLAGLIRDAKKKGVHLYPIAASDTDAAAEYQMRSAAQMTGGRYVFLTNDSGIGNDHAEPHIPCYSVTRLDSAIVRMIAVELTGRHIEPEANEVVRSVGRPNAEGKCKLASGMLVASY